MGKEFDSSILLRYEEKRRCFYPNCYCSYDKLQTHHVFGAANRKWSQKYKLTIPLCAFHHNMSDEGIHFNKPFRDAVQKMAQEKFEETYPELDFVSIFGRNYKGE